jgi:DNA-binding MarR family transcriptional regulator
VSPRGDDPRSVAGVTDAVRADAARVSETLEAIRKIMRDSIGAQARSFRVPLTAPQMTALQILVDELRDTGTGLTQSELSARMGLAHSTVSGIVARLQRRGLLQRTPHTADRRFVMIELTQQVTGWLRHDLPRSRVSPLAAALSRASEQERVAILKGLGMLHRLLIPPP